MSKQEQEVIREGSYRLLRHIQGKCHFAHARVQIEPAEREAVHVASGTGTSIATWIAAAQGGVCAALMRHRERSLLAPVRVSAVLRATVVDTCDSDAMVAMHVATLRALGWPESRFESEWADGHWLVGGWRTAQKHDIRQDP